MSNYQEMKEKAREEAIEWQLDFDGHCYSWANLLTSKIISKLLVEDTDC